MSVLFSLLRSRLLRPVFIALGLAMLVQVGLAVWLTRATVDGLVNDLTQRLGGESQRLAAELGSAEKEMSAGLAALSSNTRERLSGGLTGQLKDEQAQLRKVLEENLKQSGNSMAQLLAGVAPKSIWDNDAPALTALTRIVQRDPAVLFAVFYDAQGQRLTRNFNRSSPRVRELVAAGQGDTALAKLVDAASRDPKVHMVEVDINPMGASIGKVQLGMSLDGVEQELAALDSRFATLVGNAGELVDKSLTGAAQDSTQALQQRLKMAEQATTDMARNGSETVQQAAESLRWRIASGLLVVGLLTLAVVALFAAVLRGEGRLLPGVPVGCAVQAGSPGTPLFDPELSHAESSSRPFRGRPCLLRSRQREGVAGTMARCWHYPDRARPAQILARSS